MLSELKSGDHLCCIYESEEEHQAVLVPFLRQGLERNEKVVYIVDSHTAEIILNYLRGDGLDVEPYLSSGQLVILTHNDAYMREGVFDPEKMIALLRSEMEKALSEGYSALRITGEMTWALRGLPGSERLIEYEARLNEFFPSSRCLAICQYDRRRFEPGILLSVLRTHPIVMVGMEVCDNFYYIPPAELLGGAPLAAELHYSLRNLSELNRTERAIRQYAERLRILHEIDRAILEALSPGGIAQATLGCIRKLIPYNRASVILFDYEGDQDLVLAIQVNGENRKKMEVSPPPMVRSGETYVVDDLTAVSDLSDVDRGLLLEGIRSYVNVPLIARGRTIGSLNLYSEQPGAFSEEHIEIAREVADVLAIAIQQARLHEQIQRYADRLEERVAERTAELQERIAEVELLNRALTNLLEDLKAANWKLETSTRRLKQVNEELESFVYSVSHDLRAPLRAIQGFAQALLEEHADRLSPSGGEYARRIVAAAERMDMLINDLLDYNRLSRAEIRLQRISLERVVDEAISQLEAEIRRAQAQITVERPMPEVMGHHTVLVQVVGNLLSNAIKFVAPGVRPEVRVWAEERDGQVRLWVEDNGIGIPPEHCERIFRIFERLHGIESYPGTGIGLAIVRKGMDRMGGQAGVESEVGRGSRFWVELNG
jgi:signal transduction histidine kinase